jgi:hypothetical protein
LVTANPTASFREESSCLRFDVLVPNDSGYPNVLLYDFMPAAPPSITM